MSGRRARLRAKLRAGVKAKVRAAEAENQLQQPTEGGDAEPPSALPEEPELSRAQVRAKYGVEDGDG